MEGNLSWRHALAFLVTLTSAWLIWNGTRLVLTEPDRSKHMPVMHVSLARPPAPPAPPKVVPKPPKPTVQKPVAARTPLETSPHAIGPPPMTNAPVAAQNTSSSPPAPPAPPAPSENVPLQNTYLATVREAIEEQKRYPDSKDARLQQPSGIVTVWLVLNRSGELVNSGIENSAGSLLDRAAKESVKRASFPPFPASAWPNEQQHRFTAELNFHSQ